MRTCPHCGGEFYRHGKTHYKRLNGVGVRYICRQCKKSHTERLDVDPVDSYIPATGGYGKGQPVVNDWRYAE